MLLPRTVLGLMLAVVLALLPGLFVPAGASAQRLTDYFELSYGMSGLSQNEVKGDEAFHVTIWGEIVCKKDLPVKVAEAIIVGRVVAQDAGGTRQILNPRYVVTISPFPAKAGERFAMTSTVNLRFPPGAPSGVYQIVGEHIEARVSSSLGDLDLSRFLPGSRTAGSVVYTGSAPGQTTPATPNLGVATSPLPPTPITPATAPAAPVAPSPTVTQAPVVPTISTTPAPAPFTEALGLRGTPVPTSAPIRTAGPQPASPPSAAPDGMLVPVILILLAAAVAIGYLLGRR